jgi:hypothetical protein
MFKFVRFLYSINRLNSQPTGKYWILPVIAYTYHTGYIIIKEEIKENK